MKIAKLNITKTRWNIRKSKNEISSMDPMEEQNHSVNDSEMGNPSILSVFLIFCHSYSNVYFALYIFMIEWRRNK